jgi:YidC/Oxa1 family membrane protein insertase
MDGDQKRAFLAVVLSGAILFGWQYFFAPKPQPVQQPIGRTQVVNRESVPKRPNRNSEVSVSQNTDVNSAVKDIKLDSFVLKNKDHEYAFDNNLTILNASNTNSVYSYQETVESKEGFRIYFDLGNGFGKRFFKVNRISDTKVLLTSESVSGEVNLHENGKLMFNFSSSDLRNVSMEFNSAKKELDNNQFRQFIYLDDDLETIKLGDDERIDKSIRWFGIDFNYHIFLASFSNKKSSLLKSTTDSRLTANLDAKNNFEFSLIFTKKEYNHLKTLGDNIHLSVDFGIWSILAEPMLLLLQFFYNLIPNYGLAIILLTLMIRLITFPLQWKSFKSMKKMQIIQPELTALKAKFKDDPQRMQKESMELFKRAGANPLGGCLPLFLQMPVFFALYKVLYGAVELVEAPFYFWIHDLSIKDPFYVLPVLMAGAMFLQQKLSPTTVADPTQKKVMMFMPLIFGLIMKDLPAGLCLYIFISTIFGLAQQMFVYKRTT